ncbi:uncharacterized protein LOC132792653 isoform X1 [Drosophila nasuta]|uniref:uncharacterized protein LOC132792653 isoform X1 n=1 Tax=Drosophila nasuta TaxID=42062 RepID=UPI00295EEC9B|nr:uncharacterized protein LOC132792653 isoform X1 [Drosophila nasuta]
MFKTWIKIWPEIEIETAEQRRRFVYRTFITFGCFLLLALVQWVPIVCFPKILDVVRRHESTFVVTFLMAMLFLAVFLLSDQIRYMPCVSWVLVILVVECEIVALSLLEVESSIMYLVIGLLVAMIVMVFAIVLALLMPRDLTKSMNFMFTVSFFTLLLSIYVVVFLGILRLSWPFFVYAAIIVLMLLPSFTYHISHNMTISFTPTHTHTHLHTLASYHLPLATFRSLCITHRVFWALAVCVRA